MREEEARQLAEATVARLSIRDIVTPTYIEEVISEADGHPYIIKILLGEVAKDRKPRKVERVVADQDDVLTALFERTYADLSSLAKRIFLTICSWKSVIPELGLRAVLLRSATERIDAGKAIDELERVSLIETFESTEGDVFTALHGRNEAAARIEKRPFSQGMDSLAARFEGVALYYCSSSCGRVRTPEANR